MALAVSVYLQQQPVGLGTVPRLIEVCYLGYRSLQTLGPLYVLLLTKLLRANEVDLSCLILNDDFSSGNINPGKLSPLAHPRQYLVN